MGGLRLEAAEFRDLTQWQWVLTDDAGAFVRELLDHSLILGEAHLRAILAEYRQHYNTARPRQGINQRVPSGEDHPPRVTAGDFRTRQILRKPILSGLINKYARTA